MTPSEPDAATAPDAPITCQICGKRFASDEAVPGELIRESTIRTIEKSFPDWSSAGWICYHDLNRFRAEHIEDVLEIERGELTALEDEVVRSLAEHELVSRNIEAQFERNTTFGERLSDHIAEFGGSWKFLILFGLVMATWIAINSGLMLTRPYDPFPFILLNLVLSCLAAVQAPIIMMSQNRQEQKDRLRGEYDYRVDLKSELEVRNLNAKVDLLLTHQWRRLLEIQRIQMEMMQELLGRAAEAKAAATAVNPPPVNGGTETPSS